MPKYSYETFSDLKKESQSKQKERKVGYFKLQKGEEAIVRFVYAEPKDFEIATVHEVKVQDKYRTVLCLRNAKDPLDTCPLCANGTPLKSRFYAKLLHYVVDANGNVKVVPEVASWAKRYADVLKSRYAEYGNLNECLFKVTRLGDGKDTSYDIQYANPIKYSESNGYVKDFSAFEDFDLAHHSYIERSKEDIEEFLQSGEFPMPKKNNDADKMYSSDDSMKNVTAPVPEGEEMPIRSMNQQVNQTDEFMQRPRRTYDIR